MSIKTPILTFLRSVKHLLPVVGLACGILFAASARAAHDSVTVTRDPSTGTEWVTVVPREFADAINNPLKGFRDYKKAGYGLLERIYIPWNVIEHSADDGVERIIAHINDITITGGKRFEELNVKLVPRVYLDWDGSPGTPQKPKQHWPADLHTFDYDSPAFQERLKALVAKLGKAWDDDPRIFAVQMGLIGHWGEHHHPAPTAEQRRLLTEEFQKAFKNKPVLVRHTDREFMEAGFGIYYDTFANLDREPPDGPKDQFPWQATHVHRDIWKRAPIEGEVEYNWQQQRASAKPTETFGRTPDETMKVPAYRRYMVDKIRRYHASYLGWIDNYTAADRDVLAGAAEIQEAFGYRFVLDAVSYPRVVQPGGKLAVQLSVRNTGSAPFYLDWPVAVALLDAATKKPVWSAPLNGVDIRRWLPGEDWDSAAFSYRSLAKKNDVAGEAALPADLKSGDYILALAILDRQGGMTPSVRFATENYFRGGWHPFGFIGVGRAPQEVALKNITFDSPTFDDSLRYQVPEKLLAVKAPPLPQVKAVTPWTPDPRQELINPWRYWNLEARSSSLEKIARADGPVEGPAGRRVIGVEGNSGRGSSLHYTFEKDGKLPAGRYRFVCRVRGTAGQSVVFEVTDGWRGLPPKTTIPLTSEWREHIVEFELKNPFKDETRLRFLLPQDATGTFELTGFHLREADNLQPSQKKLLIMKRLLIALCASILVCGWTAVAAERAPNIVYLLVDDLGYADCGFMGGRDIRTPHIDQLAKGGVVLESFYVQPVYSPTRAALLTGRYATHTGVYTIVRPGAPWGLPLAERLLPEALREAGYSTFICGKWHLGEFQPEYTPTRRGFDHQYGHMFGAIDYFTHKRDGKHDWYRDDKPSAEEGYSTHLVAKEACRIIRDQPAGKPLFLYVPFNGIHAPHQVPESYKEPYRDLKEPRRSIAGMLAAVDEAIGQITTALEEKGLRRDTLIIFSSDNGGPGPGRATMNTPLRAGKGTIYEGGIRACAFVNWPGKISPNTTNKEPMHAVNWYPTLLKLAGAPTKQKLAPDGLDIWPVLTKGAKSPHEVVLLLGTVPGKAALRMGDWKLLLNASEKNAEDAPEDEATPSGTVELYNLAEDIGETKNLAATQPGKVKELRASVDALLKNAATPGNPAAKAAAKPATRANARNK